MIPFFIILLIISQLICFYFLIILNTRVAKFKDLELRQDKVIREMDDAISVYLMEMREENNRLIQELSNIKKNEIKNNEKNLMSLESDRFSEGEVIPMLEKENEKEFILDQKNIIPKTIVKNAYNRQKVQASSNFIQKNNEPLPSEVAENKTEETSLEELVVKLHHEGKTVEEIAKITQKGKTEIELLIKFHV